MVPSRRDETAVATPPSLRLSIRFRISIILLLATFNTVALAALSIVLISTLREGASGTEIATARNIASASVTLNERLLSEAPTEARRMANLEELERLAASLDALGPAAGAAREELELYRGAVERFYAHRHELAPVGEDDDDLHAHAHTAELRLAHRRFVGSVQAVVVTERPVWVDQIEPLLGPALIWIVACAAVTLALALSLQSTLSGPLARLAARASGVAGGRLDEAVEDPGGASEVHTLAVAMEAMRGRLVGLIRDLDRRNQETATILGNMLDGVMLARTDGTVLEANPAAEALLRLLAGDTAGASGEALSERLPELTPAVLQSNEEVELQLVRGPLGTRRRFVELRLRAVEGSPDLRVVMLRDVTAERELEQMKSDFMSVVTHELKTPLTAIDGYAKLLMRGKAGALPERATGFVRTIHDQASVLKDMVQNMLDTSRLEAGNLPIHAEPNDLAEVLRTTTSTWRGSVEARGLRFESDLAEAEGVRVLVDPFRLQQVLGNLLSNALKFTPEGAIGIGAEREGSRVRIWVRDTGRGIPPEAMARVFDKFFQVERGDTRVAGGAGLGLYICRALVEAQGGTIGVRSSPGEGSRFHLEFPVIEEQGP